MSGIRAIFSRYPLLRGMVSYSIIWPTSALIQQKLAGKSWNEIDWAKCARFSFYGGLYVAPTLYTWIRISSKLFPRANFRSALFKVWSQCSKLQFNSIFQRNYAISLTKYNFDFSCRCCSNRVYWSKSPILRLQWRAFIFWWLYLKVVASTTGSMKWNINFGQHTK